MKEEFKDQLRSLSEIVVKEETEGEPYGAFWERFNLPGNPFPPSGIADVIENIPPFRDELTTKLLNFIRTSYLSGETRCMILSGDYGTGKTHTLRFIQWVVNTYMSKGDHSARAIYVERPRIEANELNRTILRSIGYDTIKKYVWFVIRKEMIEEINSDAEGFQSLKRKLTLPAKKSGTTKRLWDEEKVPIPSYFFEVFNDEILTDHRTFLRTLESKNWDREQVRHYLVDCLVKAIGEDVSVDLAQIFVALLLAKDETSFSSWEKIVGISNPKALASLRAPTFLQFLIRLLSNNGISHVYLLIDEFEEIPTTGLLSARQRQEYLYTMREVLDKIREGLTLVIAITPPALVALVELAVPLADRNEGPIYLPPVELNDAVKLVQFYFDREREDAGLRKGRRGDIKPLSRELLSYVLEKFPSNAQRTPRNVIQFLHRLLNHAAEENLEQITEETVGVLLSEFGTAKLSSSQGQRRRK